MPSTLEVRRRIASVKNVAQITRALQMVASSKMRRAQERVLAARPYSEQLIKLLSRLSAEAEGQEDLPLMRSREVRKVGILLVTPDKGLAGALSSNVNRRAAQLAIELRRQYNNPTLPISFIAVGRKGRDFAAAHQPDASPPSSRCWATSPRPVMCARSPRSSKTPISMRRWTRSIWSIPDTSPPSSRRRPSCRFCRCSRRSKRRFRVPAPQYIFEPDAETILGALLERYVETLIYQPLLETVASFYRRRWSPCATPPTTPPTCLKT